MHVNHGEWSLTVVEADVSAEAQARWNRVPEQAVLQPS
jgi:hypothetical protein